MITFIFLLLLLYKHTVNNMIFLRIPKLLWKKFYFFLYSNININVDNNKNQKSDFYKNKKINSIEDIDVNKIFFSKKESCGTKNSFKFFIGYNDDDAVRPLCIRLPEMTDYARKFD